MHMFRELTQCKLSCSEWHQHHIDIETGFKITFIHPLVPEWKVFIMVWKHRPIHSYQASRQYGGVYVVNSLRGSLFLARPLVMIPACWILFSDTSIDYLKNHCTNTRPVYTHLNVFSKLNLNMAMKFKIWKHFLTSFDYFNHHGHLTSRCMHREFTQC